MRTPILYFEREPNGSWSRRTEWVPLFGRESIISMLTGVGFCLLIWLLK